MVQPAIDPESATSGEVESAAVSEDGREVMLHASAIAWAGRALVFTGASGCGKSTMSLMLMAYGARLIADDRVVIRRLQDQLRVFAPPRLGGMVEARGLGLLGATAAEVPEHGHDLAALVRLDRSETERLPPSRETTILGLSAAEIWRVDGPQFAPGLLQFLKEGRVA